MLWAYGVGGGRWWELFGSLFNFLEFLGLGVVLLVVNFSGVFDGLQMVKF